MSEEKTEAPKADSAPQASGGGNKLVMILAGVNLLVTLGLGSLVFIQFQKDKKAELARDLEDKEGHGEEHGDAAGEGHGEGHGEAKADGHGGGDGHGDKKDDKAKSQGKFGKTLSLDQFTVNLSTSGSVTPKYARVSMSVELPTSDTEAEITQKMPQVRNVVIDLFNSKKPSDLVTSEGRDHLKEEIKNALNSFLVTGKVKNVFFTNFAISS